MINQFVSVHPIYVKKIKNEKYAVLLRIALISNFSFYSTSIMKVMTSFDRLTAPEG